MKRALGEVMSPCLWKCVSSHQMPTYSVQRLRTSFLPQEVLLGNL